ncbi:hypothetical protein [Spirillospora sp. CA-294931]|uniref:hypothetical protein n=1 Tax=Spirillospora sp. CA-294931 TaxID=3240042 RepID=UPI003D8E0746
MPEDLRSPTVPLAFHCEHTRAKSRVLALVSTNAGPASLQAVLTCTDAEVAASAAAVIQAAWFSGPGPAVSAQAARVLALLPDAPAASLHQCLEHAFAGTWPDRDMKPSTSRSTWGTDEIDGEIVSPATADCNARSAGERRLADLPGTVVRVTTMIEVHVHEPKRLIAAARTTGWTPLQDEGEEDPDDVLDAVMALVYPPEVPGGDNVGNEMSGELLLQTQGDELADWSLNPITTSFSHGWRHQNADDAQTPEDASPEFAELFAIPDCTCDEEGCPICDGWHLTPRTADQLFTALEIMADQAYADAENFGDRPIDENEAWEFLARLPHITHRQDRDWRRQFARACHDLCDDLANGGRPLPRCPAEEMALHLALRDAPVHQEMNVAGNDHEGLPERRDDYDWDGCSEFLFQDHDILWLFDSDYDGSEDPRSELNRELAIGDLRPAAWFKAFGNMEARDPHRGFQR